ncbi:MAG: hypothetical protein SFU86_16640 [Pirellulaceae bacterium]|nr:hypothetical protein [Pirellulaceae bacterium]
MTQPSPKVATPGLIHHPSVVLDDLCAFNDEHLAWHDFDQHLTNQLRQLEKKNRHLWTIKAVRQSLGR